MIRKTLIFAFVLLMAVPSAAAVKYVDEDYTDSREEMGFWSRLKMNFDKGLRMMRMVGGKLCSTYPDESGTTYDDYIWVECPSTVSGGCTLEEWEVSDDGGYGSYIRYSELDPGQTATVGAEEKWELYYCNMDCECTDYEEQGCGEGPCSSDELYKTRDCEDGCDDMTEEICQDGLDMCEEEEDVGEASFAVTDVDTVSTVEEGEDVSVDVTVENTGNAGGSTRVTTGIYVDDLEGQVFSMFGSFSVVTSECCAQEDFSTETGDIYLSAGETKTVTLSLEAPTQNSELECGDYEGESNWDDSFTVFAAPFDECFEGTTGQSAETGIEVQEEVVDSDNDGVPDSEDACPNTPPETEVDDRGCAEDGLPWMYIIGGAVLIVIGMLAYVVVR